MMAYCAFMDIRYYRIPNRALEAVAAAGLAVSAEACVSGAGSVGFWAAAAEGVVVFIMGLVLAAAAGFPFFLLRMVGAGDIKFMALVAGCFGLERGFWSVVIGLVSGSCSGSRKDAARGQRLSEILVFDCLYQAFDSE